MSGGVVVSWDEGRVKVVFDSSDRSPLYARILDVARSVPHGQVATYGQIALIVGGCTPRMVGYCLASLDHDSDVPWHRVINHKGMVSPRSTGHGSQLQRELLVEEGVEFDSRGRVSFRKYGWMESDFADAWQSDRGGRACG